MFAMDATKTERLSTWLYSHILMDAIDTMSRILPQSPRNFDRTNNLPSRRHLFELGIDVKHKTDHGISLYSLVCEALAIIESLRSVSGQRQVNVSKQPVAGQSNQSTLASEPVALQANMFTSVDPSFYRANDFRIRLESIVVTRCQSPQADRLAGVKGITKRLRASPPH